MKRMVIFSILLLSAYTFGQNTPKIASPKPSHDFGDILEGQVVSHSFEIVNEGTSDLKIDRVQASCGCTAVQPAKKQLKPGEKTVIKVEFDSENRMGPQHKYVYVKSNDPKTPDFKLSFTANIVDKIVNKSGKNPKLSLNQNQYDFGNVEEGKVVEAKIGFKNAGNDVLEIKDVKTSCGCTAALLSSKKLNPGENGTIKIELDTSNRSGKMVRTVTLYTNDSSNPNQTITLSVNIEQRKS
ncbi:MAG: DUF1573 domain-containing protein [Bacteroidota bacterium]